MKFWQKAFIGFLIVFIIFINICLFLTSKYSFSLNMKRDTDRALGDYVSSYDLSYEIEISKNLKDPMWKDKAEQAISVFIPENVSITSSKVLSATPETGVTVVCELSNGTTYAVRLIGENKEATVYVYFPNGYDGSLDYKPVTEKGLG